MSKTVIVFGASGTIGQGFIKATLEKGTTIEDAVKTLFSGVPAPSQCKGLALRLVRLRVSPDLPNDYCRSNKKLVIKLMQLVSKL